MLVIDDTFRWNVSAVDPTTGGKSAADSAPAYKVFEEGTDTPILTGTMTQRSGYTDQYTAVITLSAANGFESGKQYCVRSEITVGSITGVDLREFKVEWPTVDLTNQAVTNLNSFFNNGAASTTATVGNLETILTKASLIPSAPAAVSDIPTAAQNAAGVLDLTNGIESGLTLRQALRLLAAVVVGKSSGGGTASLTFRNAVADTKGRVTATQDSNGNWTQVTTDGT